MLTELGRRMDEHGENFNDDTGNMKKQQSQLTNIISKKKRYVEGIKRRLDNREE